MKTDQAQCDYYVLQPQVIHRLMTSVDDIEGFIGNDKLRLKKYKAIK